MSLVVVGATYFAWGQGSVTHGTITGDVTDASGAVLPGAKIVAQNQGTGLRREAVADANGHFVMSQLPAGHYSISAAATGFKEAVVRDFQLNVDATVNIKFALNLGSVEQKVDVSAEAAQVAIDVSKAEISNVIQEIQVRELPINQRSFTALVTQQPGLVTMTNTSNAASQTPTSTAYSQGSQISANGLGSGSMAYLIDGVNINNSGFGAPGTAAGGDIPGVEGIQEFKVLSQNYSSVYGGSAGAVVSFATRSGTNDFHGSAYEFFRNDVMDAREYFNRESQGPKNPYRRNQFGATLGGPIKKDKTFFFANYEALRSRLTTTGIAYVPNDFARNGGGDGSDGRFPVFDPWGQPTEISPGVKAILEMYPRANGQIFSNGTGEAHFANYQPVNQHYGMFRFDQVLSSKDTFMARYTITNAEGYNAFFVPTYQFDKFSRLQGLSMKWTRIISNSLVNTASFSFQRSLTTSVVGPTIPVPPAAYTGNAARQLLGSINVGGGGVTAGALTTIGIDTWGPFRGAHNIFPVTDDLIYTRGNHTLKFGGQFVPKQWNWDKGNMESGDYVFGSLNDLLAGQPQIMFILQDGQQPHWKYRSKHFSWYVEDSWRVKPNVTLTLGLRHDFQAPLLSEAHNPSRIGINISRDSNTVVPGEPFKNNTWKNFAPRVGIAYDPFNNGKTVIRAGFGMFYDPITLEQMSGELTYNSPYPNLNARFGITALPPAARGTPGNPLPGLEAFAPIPFPACPALPNGQSECTVPSPFLGLLTAMLGEVRSPTSVQWNLQIERELPAGFSLGVTYMGSHSYNNIRGLEGNTSKPCSITNGRPYFGQYKGECGTTAPAVATVAIEQYAMSYDAQAKYNAGTVTLNKRPKGGISFSTSYTFAKAMSNSDSKDLGAFMLGNAGHSVWPTNPMADWSESQYSIRHRFTANGIFELPFGKGKKIAGDASGVKQVLLGGWAINPLIEIRSGIPFSVLAGVGISNVGDIVALPDRPDILRPNPVLGGVDRYFDPKAFQLQQPGYLGTAPRNSVRGPGFTEVDLSLTKKFKTSERTNLEFRAEAFNIINHPNFDLPFNQLYSPTPALQPDGSRTVGTDIATCRLTTAEMYLYSCNPTAGSISRIVGTPRQLQLALKFTF
ncbi:MAG: TonB-dependent receptor domain-containing protein [Terriglobales bacterium]